MKLLLLSFSIMFVTYIAFGLFYSTKFMSTEIEGRIYNQGKTLTDFPNKVIQESVTINMILTAKSKEGHICFLMTDYKNNFKNSNMQPYRF